MNNKPLVIYHANCVDGFGAAWCFWNHYGSNVDFHPGFFKDAPPYVTGRRVFLVDFSYKKDHVKKMLEQCDLLTILDHHISAIKDLDELKDHPKMEWRCDIDHSGAMLAWNYLNAPAPPTGLEYIEDRDLWKFKYPNSRAYNEVLFSYPYDFHVWDKLLWPELNDNTMGSLLKEGEALIRQKEKQINELLPIAVRREVIAGYDVPVANAPYFWCSEIGEKLSRYEPFAATYYDGVNETTYSLRSHKENPNAVDVSKIAFEFGGGGHKHAAGFRVPLKHKW